VTATARLEFDLDVAGAAWTLRAAGAPIPGTRDVPSREAERLVAEWLQRGGAEVGLRLRTLAFHARRHTQRALPDAAEADAILRVALRDGALVLTRRDARALVEAPPTRSEPVEAPAARASQTDDATWIEVRLVDEVGAPVPGERYLIKLPDGSTREGSLDAHGLLHLRDIDPGSCEFTFPDLDTESWRSLP
jgi:hypothetical protein